MQKDLTLDHTHDSMIAYSTLALFWTHAIACRSTINVKQWVLCSHSQHFTWRDSNLRQQLLAHRHNMPLRISPFARWFLLYRVLVQTQVKGMTEMCHDFNYCCYRCAVPTHSTGIFTSCYADYSYAQFNLDGNV